MTQEQIELLEKLSKCGNDRGYITEARIKSLLFDERAKLEKLKAEYPDLPDGAEFL